MLVPMRGANKAKFEVGQHAGTGAAHTFEKNEKGSAEDGGAFCLVDL